MKHETPTRIVVLGAGFAGAYAFKSIHGYFHGNKNVELILVNDTNHFLFTPLLHEVATGAINPTNVTEPIRKVLRCCLAEFHMTRVTGLDVENKKVQTDIGNISYDYCVTALGAETNFFDTPGAEEHTFTLKSLEDALTIKNHLINSFERASHVTNPETLRQMLTFVVVGGGPTGVELAAEMSELFRKTFSKYYSKELLQYCRLVVIQKREDVLPQFPDSLRKKSRQTLEEKSVEVLCNKKVKEVTSNSITLSNGETITTNTIVWAAGVQPYQLPVEGDVEKDNRGRLHVTRELHPKHYPEVFAIGDIANVPDENGNPLPQLAQVASKESETAAANLYRHYTKQPMKPFHYKHKGDLVSLGHWLAAGELGRFRIAGHLAWFLWRTIYLTKLISWQKKIKVAVDWTLDLFAKRDITKTK